MRLSRLCFIGFVINCAHLCDVDADTYESDSSEISPGSVVKKWQVGRVSRKHYEIINMLWKNTNSYCTPILPSTTEKLTRKYFSVFPFWHWRPISSTPSYIEFYYLNEIEKLPDKNSVINLKKPIQSIHKDSQHIHNKAEANSYTSFTTENESPLLIGDVGSRYPLLDKDDMYFLRTNEDKQYPTTKSGNHDVPYNKYDGDVSFSENKEGPRPDIEESIIYPSLKDIGEHFITNVQKRNIKALDENIKHQQGANNCLSNPINNDNTYMYRLPLFSFHANIPASKRKEYDFIFDHDSPFHVLQKQVTVSKHKVQVIPLSRNHPIDPSMIFTYKMPNISEKIITATTNLPTTKSTFNRTTATNLKKWHAVISSKTKTLERYTKSYLLTKIVTNSSTNHSVPSNKSFSTYCNFSACNHSVSSNLSFSTNNVGSITQRAIIFDTVKSENAKPSTLYDKKYVGTIYDQNWSKITPVDVKNMLVTTQNLSINFNIAPDNTEPSVLYDIITILTDYDELRSNITPPDRIKFFETYDSLTESSHKYPKKNLNTTKKSKLKNDMNSSKVNDTTVNIKLHRIEYSLGHRKNKNHTQKKFVKKDVGQLQNEIEKNCSREGKICIKREFETKVISEDKPTRTTNDFMLKRTIKSILSSNFTTVSKSTYRSNLISNESKEVSWTQYPYLAVYFYERLQVHCDAAILSSHWLLASAACLSRHRENSPGEDRSAFVTYCSNYWWEPEHINYVKKTFLHPKFSNKDVSKRHLYNVGLIKVVSSMLTNCPGYASVTTMSHDFTSNPDGSVGITLGWGLDRYSTSYSAYDLPKRPLSAYETTVYSDRCPGNNDYSQMKNMSSIKNVICVSLPVYLSEKRDPVHGSILLVGGKLVALYLQEERRSWGPQSAQYTAIWRLLPWILDVAREPDESDLNMLLEDFGVR